MTSSPHRARLLPSPLEGVYGVELCSARSFSRHWHDSYGFGVMEEGGHRSASGRGPVEALAGQVVTSNPGEVHDGTPIGQATRRWRMVHITPEAMAYLVGVSDHELTQPVLCDPGAYRRIASVTQHWGQACNDAALLSQPLWKASLEEALALVSGELMRVHGNRLMPQEGQPSMDRVRERLLDQWLDPPSLCDLAQERNLSRFQLVRQFSNAYGLPPFAWLQQQRLRRAQRQIANGMALSEAACASGFADQSHLNRLFMRCFGFTPGQWQRACRGPLQ